MVFYNWIVIKSIICIPSNLIFLSTFAPSRYESKLWDLKYKLKKGDLEKDYDFIREELYSFHTRYFDFMSSYFDKTIKLSIKSTLELREKLWI